jgi:pimeloyl-ACP methyl ester carboxylesterase
MSDSRGVARRHTLYPPIEPYEHGRLTVGDGHDVYWEACGNPQGRPALFLHGGPGGGCTADHRRLLAEVDRFVAHVISPSFVRAESNRRLRCRVERES